MIQERQEFAVGLLKVIALSISRLSGFRSSSGYIKITEICLMHYNVLGFIDHWVFQGEYI